jgi:hypothetical protein
MATSLDSDGMRIRVELVPQAQQNDISVFSVYTGKRDPAEFPQLASAVQLWINQLQDPSDAGALAEFLEGRVYFDYWQDPLFSDNGWGSVGDEPLVNDPSATDNILPPQCALVITRDTNDTELPRKRRRNRSYIGPVVQGAIINSGAIPAARADLIAQATQAFDTALGSAPLAGGVPPEYDGLCNVSYEGTVLPTGPQIAVSNQVRVGDIVDTQRRRRNGLPEQYAILPL